MTCARMSLSRKHSEDPPRHPEDGGADVLYVVSMTRWRHFYQATVACVFGWACATATVAAEPIPFVGGAAGIATLSADGRATIGPSDIAVSLYSPENGPAVNLFAGVHVSDYVSLQGNYIANANRVTLTASAGSDRRVSFYEQQRNTAQHATVLDLLVYFRERKQRVRPYLSAGLGLVHFTSDVKELRAIRGDLEVPPERFTSTAAVLRVAVGIDLTIRNGWAIRYTFSEAIRSNPISGQLSPAGQRGLANFQNLFGVVKNFPST